MPLFSVSLQGYSNSLSGETWAILVITNRDVCNLYLDAPVRVKFLDHPDLKTRQILWDANPISRRSFCEVAIQIPAASGAWSFQCSVIRYPWQQALRDRLPNCVEDWIPGSGSGYTRGYVDTGWITQ